MTKENSVERANRLIEEFKDSINDSRQDEVEAKKQIKEYEELIAKKKQEIEKLEKEVTTLESRIADEQEWIESVRDTKLDDLITVQALTLFVQQGGGLDMVV